MTWSFSEKTDFTSGDSNPSNFDGSTVAFTDAEKATILAAMQAAYDGSSIARTMFENWIAAGNRFTVSKITNDFYAYAGTGHIYLDLNFIKEFDYIDVNGNAVRYTPTAAITHELGHALTGKTDNYNVAANYYTGDNVAFMNTIYKQLGIPQEVSYIAQGWDLNANPLPQPGGNLLKTDYTYTDGAKIVGSIVSDAATTTTGSTNDLIIGGPSANILGTSDGNDFLYGAGGNDSLNGGNGRDTAVYMDTNPADYDIRKQADGSWTVRHARGDGLDPAKSDGSDTLQNVEQLQFGPQHYNLQKNGLTFETDFALVIDTTGSMGDDIDNVKASGSSIIDALFNDGKTDARVGIVGFKDTTNGEPSSVILPFTDQDSFADRKAAALAALNGIGVGGGGDLPETDDDGLLLALNGSMGDWRVGAGVHRIALFTDAEVKDVGLRAQVEALAANIGATVTTSSHLAGANGAVDTFHLSFGDSASGTSGISSPTDPNGTALPTFTPDGTPITSDPSGTTVQVYTIFIGTTGTVDTSGLSDIASATGGSFLNAPTSADLVSTLLSIISAPVPPLLPVIAGTLAGQTTSAEAPVTPFSTVTVTDDNSGATDTLTITLSGSGGTLADGTGFIGLSATGTPNVYTLASDTAAAVTAELEALVFTPTAGAPNTTSTTAFILNDDSSAGTSVSDGTTSVIDTTLPVIPVITGTLAGQATLAEAPVTPFSTVTIADANSGATDTLTIALNGGGTLADGSGFSGLSATGTPNVYVLATGTASAVTAELDALIFTPAAGSTTGFTLIDASSAGTSASDSTTSVTDTPASPVVSVNPVVSIDPMVAFRNGKVATLTGTFSDANFPVTDVEVFDGTTDLGSATLNGDGTWILDPVHLGRGFHDLSAFAFDASGAVSSQTAAPFSLQTGIRGQAYSTEEVDFDSTGDPVAEVLTQRNGEVYLAYDITPRTNGDLVLDYYGGTFFDTQDYSFIEHICNPDYSVKIETLYNNDGTHTVTGFQNALHLFSVGDDVMTGGGSNETFVFKPHFGADLITDFAVAGRGHDILSLSSREFSTFAQVINHTETVDGNAVIHVATNDTITLQNVTANQLAAHPHDIRFHA